MDMRERDIRRRLKTDFLHYADKCLKIRAKDGRILPLRLNAAQRYIHERIEAQRRDKGFVRAIILKGRQQGCTTYVQARYYWRLAHERGLRAFTLTHLDDASRNVHQMMRRFHENCPAPVRPHTGLINARELTFDRMDCSYQVGTLLGFNVVEAEDMPSIAAGSLAIAFGDFNAGYQIVDRQGVRILRDSFTAKPYVKFYTTKRVGGDVINFEAIKLLKFALS